MESSTSAIGSNASNITSINFDSPSLDHKEAAKSVADLAVPRLLRLPPEIREIIYLSLFDLCQIPVVPSWANSISSDNPSLQKLEEHSYFDAFYPYELPKYTLLPILQTCQQIRSEFQALLTRLQRLEATSKEGETRGLKYELDVYSLGRPLTNSTPWSDKPPQSIMVWTALPLPPEEQYTISELKVNYTARNFLEVNRGRFYGAGGPGWESFTLFYLCNAFFCHGPQGFHLPAINGPPRNPGGELRVDGGRCKPKVKNMIFNVKFEYDQELNNSLETLRSEAAAGDQDAVEKLNRRLGRRAAIEYSSMSLGVRRWMGMMLSQGYFDDRIEKITIVHDRDLALGKDVPYEEPASFEYNIPSGLEETPIWKPVSYYESYGYHWGPKSHLGRRPRDHKDAQS
ncbi:hypothetical protein TWF694_009053 [Orbilia ellipsospora]|uniref:F-box domain-containing protein n=1 Tax=Orbilia ellipsospora TaxID=2528407 RepID=A0AAV9XEB0_9PEZI